jgi:uncharacterized protein (DUF885 family)
MWRAIRLVVDTGIHSRGWTRRQAIDYFRDNTAQDDRAIEAEIDRYVGVQPAVNVLNVPLPRPAARRTNP